MSEDAILKFSLKGKTKPRISVQMEDILPSITKAIKEDLGLPDDAELHYTSTTRFITFDLIRTDKQRERCQCRACMEKRLQEEEE